jgi:hypothetical protein
MNPHIPKWIQTLGIGILWSLKFSKIYFRGQISLDQRVSYTIKKFLKLICLKWAHMTHLSKSYGQKKGWESKCQFDFYSLKVWNLPEISVCRWHATYLWKYLNEDYNFALDLTWIGGLYKKLWPSKVLGVPILRISKLPSWESHDKMTFGCNPHD